MNTTQLTRFCPQERDSKTVGAKLNLPIHIYKMFSLARHSRDNGNPDIFLYRTSAAGRRTGLAKTIRRIILWVTALLPLCAAAPTPQTGLFLGDTITAGYGLDSPQAYPDLIQKKIDANGWSFKVVDAGQSGGTTAGGWRRLTWALASRVQLSALE